MHAHSGMVVAMAAVMAAPTDAMPLLMLTTSTGTHWVGNLH